MIRFLLPYLNALIESAILHVPQGGLRFRARALLLCLDWLLPLDAQAAFSASLSVDYVSVSALPRGEGRLSHEALLNHPCCLFHGG